MPRPTSDLPTEREAQLLEALWHLGPSSAEAVRAQLADDTHDSTVRTLLRVLVAKGYVRVRGRQPAVYEAAVPREKVRSSAARSLLARFFGGSAEDLVMQLVEDERLSALELARLRTLVSRRLREGGKS